MITGVLLLIYIYYPIAQIYLFPNKSLQPISKKGMSISIPKIYAQGPIIPNVNPWKESEYLPKLRLGVALAKGYAAPGDGGVSFLFAHSSDLPWNITRYNTAFFRIGELLNGDKIFILRDGKRYVYRVYDKKVVWPNQVEYLKRSVPNGIILQTCTPIGTNFQRLLVYAKLI